MLLGYYNKNQEFKELNTWTEYKKYPNIKNSPINIYDLNQKLIFSTNIVLYMCSFCKQTHKTTFITFRNRYLKYKNYEYLSISTVKPPLLSGGYKVEEKF